MAATSWLLPIPRGLGTGVLYISEVGAFQEKKETWHPLAFPGQHLRSLGGYVSHYVLS